MTQEHGQSTSAVAREHLLTGAFNTHIDRIESHRITLQPVQKSGSHVHPGAVLGYIVDGAIAFTVEGHSPRMLCPGNVFYEPPGATSHILTMLPIRRRSSLSTR